MIEICNDKTKLTPLEYILNNNDVKIDIEFNYDLYLINDKLKKTFDDKIDTIIYYLSYYGIDYYNYYNDYYNDMGICYMHFDDNLSFGHMRKLNIAKDDLEILDKDQMINLLNSMNKNGFLNSKILIGVGIVLTILVGVIIYLMVK